jgi:tetratricopeptide (TPR) repeat protein
MKRHLLFTVLSIGLSVQVLNAQTIKEAERFVRNEQYEDAAGVYTKLIAKKPKDGMNYYYSAVNHLLKGDSIAAIQILDQGAINAPKCKMILVGKGMLALRQGNNAAAENYFVQAQIISKKKKGLINKEIGRAYLSVVATDEKTEIANAEKAKTYLEVAVDDFETKLLLGDALMVINKADLSQAVQQFIVSGYEQPEDPRPLLKEAYVYRRVKNYELSKLRISEALSKDLEYAPAYRQMAEVLQLMGQKDSSIYYFEQYLKRNNNLSARVKYVEALYLNSEFDRAISEGKALLKQKEVPNIYGVIAYAVVGKKDATTEEIKDGLENFKMYEEKFVAPKNRQLFNREMYFKATLLYRADKQKEAFELFTKVLQDTAKASESMYDAVREQYYNLGSDLHKEISKLEKDNIDGVNDLQIAILKGKKYGAFDKAYKTLELKRVKNGGTLNLRDLFFAGRCLDFMERYEESVKTYNEIITQDTNYISGYYLVAQSSALLDPTDSTGNVTAAYNRWLNKLTPEDQVKFKKDIENAYRNMAFYAQKNKKYEQCSYYYGKVLEVNPEDTVTADIKARIDEYLEKLRAREARQRAAGKK